MNFDNYDITPIPQPVLADDGKSREIYIADEAGKLEAAIAVALMLGKPLLLTGEPGVGKTRLAYYLAQELKDVADKPLRFDVKSTSEARDLFYRYDALGHYHAADIKKNPNPLPHIQLEALGQAILRTHDADSLAQQVTDEEDRENLRKLLKQHAGEADNQPCRSVVLIDEIDKAPRDFPNDILNEIEAYTFRLPELGLTQPIRINPAPAFRPVVVMTSNSEKHLPEAFLRRCVYYHIPFPDKLTELQRIIDAKADQLNLLHGRDAQRNEALQFFLALRTIGLGKPPATAELLNWLMVLPRLCEADQPLTAQPENVKKSFSALLKTEDDSAKAVTFWEGMAWQTM